MDMLHYLYLQLVIGAMSWTVEEPQKAYTLYELPVPPVSRSRADSTFRFLLFDGPTRPSPGLAVSTSSAVEADPRNSETGTIPSLTDSYSFLE